MTTYAELRQQEAGRSHARRPVKTLQIEPRQMVRVGDAIRADLAAGDAGYRAAGDKFIAQKAALPHGEWLPWLKAEGFGERQAQRLMEFAKSDASVAFTDICHPKPLKRRQESPCTLQKRGDKPSSDESTVEDEPEGDTRIADTRIADVKKAWADAQRIDKVFEKAQAQIYAMVAGFKAAGLTAEMICTKVREAYAQLEEEEEEDD